MDDVTSFTAIKDWNDSNNQDGLRTSSIFIQLYGNGKIIDFPKELNDSNSWLVTWNNLPINDEKGQKIVYTVTETTSLSGYTTSITNTNDQLATIENKHIPDITDIEGQKLWDDQENQDGKRPNKITIYLFANGVEINGQDVYAEDNWTYHFINLPMNDNGKKIEYTVEEGFVDNYTSTTDGFNITNSHTPEKTQIEGKKTWNDANNQDGKRPTNITVNLLADGVVISSKEVSEKENWAYSFTDLDKFNDGKEINYTVTENTIPEYSTEIDESNITNSYTPGKQVLQ